jgi:hypothetical protein
MATWYRVTLTKEEVGSLEEIARNGVRAARTVLYARALLLLDQGEFAKAKWMVDDVAIAVGLTDRALVRLKERFVKYGLDAALERKKPVKPSRDLIFDGVFAAKLTQLACSEVPDGHSRWTIRLLADKLIELKIVPSVSTMTVCNTLKKMNCSLTGANTGKFRLMETLDS